MIRCSNLQAVCDTFMTIEAPRRFAKGGKATRTLKNRQPMLRRFLSYEVPEAQLLDRSPTHCRLKDRAAFRRLAWLSPDAVTAQDFRDWLWALAHETVGGRKPISLTYVNDHRAALLAIFRWASDDEIGLMSPEVFAKLDRVKKVDDGRTPARTPKDIESIPDDHLNRMIDGAWKHASTLPTKTKRQRERQRSWKLFAIAMMVLRDTGMRRGEFLSMTPSQIRLLDDYDANEPNPVVACYMPDDHKTRTKNKKRRAWLTLETKSAIDEAIETRRWDGNQQLLGFALTADTPIFQQWTGNAFYRKMVRFAAKMGLPTYHPHQLRHTFATKAAPHDLEGTRSQLGHSDIRTTKRYIDDDGRAARRLLGRLSPQNQHTQHPA